jgi:hypothetical protein
MKVAVALAATAVTIGCGARTRENFGQNVAINGREDKGAYVVNTPKGWDNVMMKCIGLTDGGVVLVSTAREQAGVSTVRLDACPPDVAKAQGFVPSK